MGADFQKNAMPAIIKAWDRCLEVASGDNLFGAADNHKTILTAKPYTGFKFAAGDFVELRTVGACEIVVIRDLVRIGAVLKPRASLIDRINTIHFGTYPGRVRRVREGTGNAIIELE